MTRPPPPLADRFGVLIPPSVAARIDAKLTQAERLATASLGLPDGVLEGRLVHPRSFRDVLELTSAEALGAGLDDHAHALVEHYAAALPFAALLQQCSLAPPLVEIFHTPVDWSAMTRFRSGLEALRAALAEAGLAAKHAPGGLLEGEPRDWPETLGALYAHTYFGRCFPMFAAHANDLAALDQEIATAATAAPARWDRVDYRLGAALLHEILHFGPDREALFPPYLDEALAGYLGTRFLRETAFPAVGEDNALDGFPWFGQVGQALVRAFGLGPVLTAHVGEQSWREVLGDPLVDAFERLGWAAYRATRPLHFHPDTRRPDRWVKLVYLARAGRPVSELGVAELDRTPLADCGLRAETDAERALEQETLEHALAAMCLETVPREVRAPSAPTTSLTVWRVRTVAPATPIVLDFRAGVARTRAQRAEDPDPLYALPPGLCVEAVEAGVGEVSVVLESAERAALGQLAETLLAGRLEGVCWDS